MSVRLWLLYNNKPGLIRFAVYIIKITDSFQGQDEKGTEQTSLHFDQVLASQCNKPAENLIADARTARNNAFLKIVRLPAMINVY